MGIFSIQKNGKQNNNNNRNMGMNPNMNRPDRRNVPNQPMGGPKDMVPPKMKESNEFIGTFDRKNIKKDIGGAIAPVGVTKQKTISSNKVEDIDLPVEKKDLDIQNISDSYELQAARLDPMDNSNNPIPVNPIAPLQEEFVEQEIDLKNVKANFFSLIGMIVGMTLRPGTTIINNAKKYRSAFKASLITIWITLLTLVSCVIVRVIVGSFVRTSSVVTGASSIQFNPALLFTPENYVEYLTIAFLASAGAIFVTAIVYYASSFVNSKGVPLGSYLMISNLSLLPFILGVVVLYPVCCLFTRYIGVAVVVFTFLYSLITFFIGMNRILVFKNIDRQILYNVLNLSAIIMIMIIIVIVLLRADILVMPEMVI